jgi:AcrR family transcriptional regulator
MPRPRGDHAARRQEVVRATWRLIGRSGVDGATIRAVASELGVATKAVTRYFKSKDELLLLALDRVIDQQIEVSVRTAGDLGSADALVRSLLSALPTTDRVRKGWRIWVAFLGRAVGSEPLQRQHRRRYDRLRRTTVDWLTRLAEHGAIPRSNVSVAAADELLALIDGIGVREAVNPGSIPAARQRAMVTRAVGRLVAADRPGRGPARATGARSGRR